MSDREEHSENIPPCKYRRRVNGMDMCYAIGCCEVGDMACECYGCDRKPCVKQTEGAKPSVQNGRFCN